MGEQGRRGGGGPEPALPAVTFGPLAEYPPLTPDELTVLREVGQRWGSALRDHPLRQAELPLDPALGRYPPTPVPTRFGRLAPIEMFRAEEPGELVATERAAVPESGLGRALARVRRVVLGPALVSAAVLYERMRKLVALPVLSSDLLSSVAYGPEAMLTILALGGSAALGLSLPIAAALVVLMIAVGLSYRQTIPAYPHGAGSYIVASDNLGRRPGLTAAAGLMMDYVLTVAVSVSTGIQTITSALPALTPLTVPLGLLVIAVLLAGNLRGVRSAGYLFAAPTYLFLGAMFLLLVVGLGQAAARGFTPVPPPPTPVVEGVGLFLVLRAFSSGATSMTGIEAVSNAVPAFRPPEWRNGRATLTWMLSLLIVMFAGLMVLIHLDGVAPRPEETVLSQLTRRTFSTGPWYVIIQAATALILLFAANTAYNDFPRLLFFMARDGYAPRRFLHLGDRLALTDGIIALSVGAGLIFFAFGGKTQSLIPLFAVGVFLAFTLSQAGMVMHWRRVRGPHWRKRLTVNAVGALLSAVVLLTAAVSKFAAGAWVVVIAVPAIILLSLWVRRHYDTLERALRLHPPPTAPRKRLVPLPAEPAGNSGTGKSGAQETEESPQEVRHLIVVPIARFNLAALRALAYAASFGSPAFAIHISPDDEEADRFREQWETWGDHLRLEIIVSPYRAIIPPLAHYLDALHTLRPDIVLTVVLPEIVVRHRWHELLHSRTRQRLRRALRHLPGIVITSVPIHLSE